MKMPTYRVTEKKIEEHLGCSLLDLHSWKKNKLLLVMGGTFILLGIVLLIFGWWFKYWWMLLPFGLTGLAFAGFSIMKNEKDFYEQIVPKMKELVQDPGILWLNAQKAENEVKKWGREGRGILNEDTFKILAYLKKEGGSQGIYHQIKVWKNSNSAQKKLKRLHRGEWIGHDGIDFRYLPWEFKVVSDENLIFKEEPEKKRVSQIEQILNKAWGLMLDEEAEGWK